MFPSKNFKNPKIPYATALFDGAAGGGSESSNKEHLVVVALESVIQPSAVVTVPSAAGAGLRRGPDILATERYDFRCTYCFHFILGRYEPVSASFQEIGPSLCKLVPYCS